MLPHSFHLNSFYSREHKQVVAYDALTGETTELRVCIAWIVNCGINTKQNCDFFSFNRIIKPEIGK